VPPPAAVIAYDRLGFGRSDPRDGTLDLDFIADEARSYFAAVRRHHGFTGFIVLGHSVGGGMAVNCAAQFPDDCKAVITIAAQAFLEDRTVKASASPRNSSRTTSRSTACADTTATRPAGCSTPGPNLARPRFRRLVPAPRAAEGEAARCWPSTASTTNTARLAIPS
jgi:pimeloyl-ACP methyl ester carboxylesterase